MSEKITLAKGLNMGLRKAMEDDPKVLLMGEDVGKLGGVFRITDMVDKRRDFLRKCFDGCCKACGNGSVLC